MADVAYEDLETTVEKPDQQLDSVCSQNIAPVLLNQQSIEDEVNEALSNRDADVNKEVLRVQVVALSHFVLL